MKRALFVLAALAVASSSHAATWYVSASGDDAAAGDSPGAPLLTLAAAVARAGAGDAVLLAEGTYAGNVTIDAKSGLAISGGWDAAFAARDAAAHPTTIAGDTATPTLTFSGGTGYAVDGVTVRGGAQGILVRSALPATQPVTLAVTDCTVTGAGTFGIFSEGAWLVVDRSRLVSNQRSGIAAFSPYETNRADITRCLIADNGIHDPSGGLYLISMRQYRVYNNVIAGNNGFGVWIAHWGSTALVFNNTIVGNSGGGVGTGYYKNMWIRNNVIAFNGQPGVNNVQGNWIAGDNNDVFGNTGGDYFQSSPSPGDLSVDPGLDADYRLTATSPLVNAGVDLSDYLVDDLDGQPRALASGGDGLFDVGADEYWPDAIPPVTQAAVAGAPGLEGWYASPVSVTLSASDEGGSGIASTEYSLDGLAWTAYGAPFELATEGDVTFWYRSTDRARNVEAARSETVRIDATGPAIAIAAPAEGASYRLNEPVTADWSASDATSGLASATGTVASGAAVDTSTVGTKAFRVDAADVAGNASSGTVSYDVRYVFGGVQPPLRADGSGTSRLGAPLVVKFRLLDWTGLAVPTAIARLFVAPITGGVPGAERAAVPMGGANAENLFRWDAQLAQYVFNMSTAALPAGACQLRIALDDGTSQLVTVTLTSR